SSRRGDVDPLLEGICLKATAKLPAQRYAGMADLAAALADYLAGRLSDVPSTLSPAETALETVLREFRAAGFERGRTRAVAGLALHQALEKLGRDHPLTGAVLDMLGRVYAGRCNFRAACEFYQQAIAFKRQHDEAGLALSHEELGWLFVDYGQLDRAEEELT